MHLTLTADEREQLTAAAARERRVRHWRRYQSLLLLAEDRSPVAVAEAVGCSRASVYNWIKAWQEAGIAGLAEAPHAAPLRAHTVHATGRAACARSAGIWAPCHRLDGAAPARGDHPRGLRSECADGAPHRASVGMAPEATEVCARPARSRLRGKKGALTALIGAVLAAGGSVWFGDETTLREFPLAGGVGAARGAAGGRDQRAQRAPGAAWGAEHRHGRGRTGGAGTGTGRGQRGVDRSTRGALRDRCATPAGLG